MPELQFALDKSARHIDADGRLHVSLSHISKAAVNPYRGEEIPGYQSLGLDPEKIYQLLRDPAELEKAAPTFNNIQILYYKHVPVSADDPQKDLIAGSIGSDVKFNAPYLDASLCIWDAQAIAAIDSGQIKELSCAYRYVPVMTPGEYEGEAYDGVMTEIQGNHLAIVEAGRAGSDVVVADNNPFFNPQENIMKMTKLGKALFMALSAASPVLAADSAMPALVGNAAKKTFKVKEVKEKLLALDASLDSNQLDNIIDAVMDVEQSPEPTVPAPPEMPAEDMEGPSAALAAYLRDAGVSDEIIQGAIDCIKPAGDMDMEDDEDKDKPAMDAALITKTIKADLTAQFKALDQAREDVRPTVGTVYGMDSADEVYRFALDHMKIDHKDVKESAALRALYKVAATGKPEQTNMAQDHAAAIEAFPGLKRFKQM